MSENSPFTPQSNDLNNFKEELLKRIRELETKLTSQITLNELKLSTDFQSLSKKVGVLTNNNKDILSSITSHKLKVEKISELEVFKNKVDSMLITHEVRIKKNMDEIEKIKTKYDKIISDNLYVPGYVGSSCQFRNISEYLSYNIADISRLKMEKDQLKKDMKDLKIKWDGIMKSMINMNDNTAKLCNSYTDNKEEYFKQALDHTQKELNQKSLDMRVVMQKYQNDSDQKIIDLREELNKLIKDASNLNNLINDNFYICDRQHEEMKKNITDGSDNLNKHKNLLDNLDGKIKTLQDRITLFEGVNSRVRKLYEMIGDKKYANNFINYNMNAKTISQSPPPRRIRGKDSNPELIIINPENQNMNNSNLKNNDNPIHYNSSKIILQKSVRNIQPKKLNIDFINSIPSIETPNLIKEKEEKKNNIKINISQDLNNKIQEKAKYNVKIKEKSKEDIKEVENEKKEEEKTNSSRRMKANGTNTNQVLPILTPGGRRNIIKQVVIKPVETENYINRNSYNNITTQISNDSHIQTQVQTSMAKNKKDSEPENENHGCKIVSLNLSPDSAIDDKREISKGRRPTKLKYDIVNSLINDYRAKLFSRGHTLDEINDGNNEIVDMPKRVSQAFGRTTYTFYLKKDIMNAAIANKNINGFGYNGPKKEKNLKIRIKSHDNVNNNNKLLKK